MFGFITSQDYNTQSSNYTDTRPVFVTQTGSKYHIQGCDYLNSKPSKTTVAIAENHGYSPCKVCNPYRLADSYYGTNTITNYSNINLLIFILIMFLCWIICNIILRKIFMNWKEHNAIVESALNYRKNIMFDMIVLLFLYSIDFNFLTWGGIVFYFIVAITEAILICVSIFAPVENPEETYLDELIEKNMNLLRISKILNEVVTVIMLIELFSILN